MWEVLTIDISMIIVLLHPVTPPEAVDDYGPENI